jgi:class 3 adenylate cyclase
MPSFNSSHGKSEDPLYNSRIISIFVEYIEKYYPDVDIDSILSYAGITTYELEDQGHWFSQRQIDRFHKILLQKTGDSNISREVGRYAASSKASGAIKQYTLGLMSPTSVYLLMEKLYPAMSRGATVKAKKVGPSKVEIISTPKPGVHEKPYQCENRIGQFEAVAKLFTERFATIEHPSCFHKGDDCCRYIISWEKTSSLVWKRISNYSILLSILASLALFFVLSTMPWAIFVLLCVLLTIIFSFYSKHLEKKDLTKTIETQGDAAKDLLDEINIRYNNALLVQEIGQATSMLLDIQKLLKSVMDAMEKWLDFDRGGIWLANKEKTHLIYNVGYGYRPEIENLLKNNDFHLDRQHSRGVVVKSFKEQKPYLVNDVTEIEKDLSKRSLEFVKKIGSQSFICVPVIYEGESLGVLLVDNVKSKKPLSQSEMSLLMGIAPQIAISIHNAISYQRLQESKEREHNLRKLFEKYVPAPVIKQYVDSEEVDLFRGEESYITALFLDIRSFTSSSEAMEARHVVSFLNEYFEKCSLAISKENGHINKYTGDGFFAIFGAPEKVENHTVLAFNAACRILELSERLILEGKPMGVGIGLNTGKAILGNIGSQTKIEYTAVGDTVNTAARLQEFTKLFQEFPIIMSRNAWKGLVEHPYHSAIKNLGIQKIRGKKQQMEAFGFKPLKDHPISMTQGDKGFFPLQRMRGV